MFHDRPARRRRLSLALEPLEGRNLLSGMVAAPAISRTVHVANLHKENPPPATPQRWKWLANTYWYVPKANLPATIYDPGTGAIIPIRDQTVYHITGYRNGYFWGETVFKFGPSAPSSSSLIGSVTPEGRILLSFHSTSGVTTQGYGEMTRKRGRWTMENQMFTSSNGTEIGHWAYMVQTRPGMKSWRSLPFVKVSVPTFLSNYSAPVPTPVGT
jgi:hypothetical protein